jgi:hypothetical protein
MLAILGNKQPIVSIVKSKQMLISSESRLMLLLVNVISRLM